MGLLISRFKRKKTTLELLDKLEKDITSIEQYRLNSEQRRRIIVGQLVVYSVGVYVLAAVFFYFQRFPSTFKGQLLCITPLLLFPFVVILLRKIITFYYSRKITHNEQKLCNLREEKKRILDDVMDKETYKIARTILEKFAPEQLRSKEVARTPDKMNSGSLMRTPMQKETPQYRGLTPLRPGLPSGVAGSDLRRRTFPSTIGRPQGTVGPPSSLSSENIYQGQLNTGATPRSSINGQSFNSDYRPPGPPMPRPVLPRERSYLDRVVEYLVGDGPSNRYALICQACESHNGMALKEEFEYLPFRCCYCHYWNPARKQRPLPPRLTPTSMAKAHGSQVGRASSEDTSDSEKYSDSDSDDSGSGPELEAIDKQNNEAKVDPEKEDVAGTSEAETSLDREAAAFLKSLDARILEDASDTQERNIEAKEGPKEGEETK